MAATRSKRRDAGELPEDHTKKPSNLLKELIKINQKAKTKTVEPVRQGRALEQNVQTPSAATNVEELPFVEVEPLPFVARGQTKTNGDVAQKDHAEKLLDIPKLVAEPGFKNRARYSWMKELKICFRKL